MKRNRFSEEQIIGILKEHEAGVPVAHLCRKRGVNDAAFTGGQHLQVEGEIRGMDVSEA
ncbi:transposase [Rhodopseudomonas faecalis]|uniref:Transposase n=1 Tax=Rhodopseudomonas faecalis TaxID=99655 RepID=A0A318T9J5_9BRAD|nr:transposase [Rhodopseudomonas faecalis]